MENFLVIFLAGLQAVMMLSDEFFFHHKRGLGTFERYGHVADTFFFLLAVSVVAFLPYRESYLYLYVGLSIFSSLFISKDEWIHAKEALGFEHWCHAVLFVSHGSLLFALGLLWKYDSSAFELKSLFFGVLLWGLYQFVYWNIYDKGRKYEKNK